MTVATLQPIAGVSASRETDIESVYPSVAAGVLGKLIGMIMECAAGTPFLPFRLIVMVAVGGLLAPLGVLAYILRKLFGNCYVLTNRSVQKRSIIGSVTSQQVSLAEIDQIEIAQQVGYTFHRVGDLLLENAAGNVLMVIPAIMYPKRLKQVILDAREARLRSDESLAQIKSRK